MRSYVGHFNARGFKSLSSDRNVEKGEKLGRSQRWLGGSKLSD